MLQQNFSKVSAWFLSVIQQLIVIKITGYFKKDNLVRLPFIEIERNKI